MRPRTFILARVPATGAHSGHVANIPRPVGQGRRAGSVLIIVLWVSFGLVSLALYFAHSMSLELRAADNRVAALEAEQGIAGAARYLTNILAQREVPGEVPDPLTYSREAVPVGDARFWLVGRQDGVNTYNQPAFGLVDEASKLNINTATREMLEWLPGITAAVAAAIIDWRDEDSQVTPAGAEDETYQRLQPAYRCKNAPFESVEELRLVQGVTLELLYGEDTNRNGILDANENDGELSPPWDNANGRLEPGLIEYVTVSSREPNTRDDGTPRINVANPANARDLGPLLEEALGSDRGREILRQAGRGGAIRSVLEFFTRSGMTESEFEQVAGDLTVSDEPFMEGMVNVNTASEAVLACVPGIGSAKAAAVVNQRRSNAAGVAHPAWVAQVLEPDEALRAGPFLTGQSHQLAADVAALGHHGRGYRRVQFIIDLSDGTPRLIHRQDLTQQGWALGAELRAALLATRNNTL
jgi:DNA uptake protein ComE-like DNA-binding protein